MRAVRVRVLSSRPAAALRAALQDTDRSLALVLAAFAVFAAVYAGVTGLGPHREWAVAAAVGYAVAAVAMLLRARRFAGAALGLGTVLLPLAYEVAGGVANPEMGILRAAAGRWLASGTPFPAPGGGDPNAYNVYLPGLALFGMPSAVFGDGPATDPRWYLLLAAVALFAWLGRAWPVTLLLCCPFVALQLVTGATDVPVLGCVCAALVCAERGRAVLGGVLGGLAAGMKAFAWPAVVVLLVLVWARSGMRTCLRCTGSCLVVVAALLLPAIVADPRAFLVNAIELPLGGLDVWLTAGSPFPGHLLASSVPGGSTIAAALLGLAAVVLGGLLLRRPPADARSAAKWLAAGLLVAVLLAPSSRPGYLIYPLGLLALPYYLSSPRQPGKRSPAR